VQCRTVVVEHAFKQIHLRAADKARNHQIRRLVINLRSDTDLLDHSPIQNDNFFAEGQRFGLIMRDVNNGASEAAMKPRQFNAHAGAQRSVEIRQRLIEKKYFRLTHDGASQGHSLSLSAAQTLRPALQHGLDFQEAGGCFYFLRDFLGRQASEAQRKCQVFKNCHMRIERVVLENKGDVSGLRRQAIHAPIVDENLSAIRLFESGDQS
jgi:hypothetical protein